MPKSDDLPHFEVHPSVVYQLGESLITDAVQALIELVKNSYDADASYAKVIIDTTGLVEVPGTFYPADGGRIIVEDDGTGMDVGDIKGGWFLISNRAKRNLKDAKETTPGGRTPLGDKGLGRLGVQRLGADLDVFTKPAKGPGHHFGFSWLDFATAPTLHDVQIHFESHSMERKKGTTLVVSSLREGDFWRGEEALKRLERELSQMISPFRAIRNFIVAVEADGKELELTEISDQLRELAPIRYRIRFDGRKYSFNGHARLDFFRPQNKSEAEEFALIAESDKGKRFFEYLCSQPRAAQFKLEEPRNDKWLVEFHHDRALDDLDGREADPENTEIPANPGPFNGEVDSFDLAPTSFTDQAQAVFNRLQEYRSHIQTLAGIRVYRDGFAIRVDKDWLKLGAQWTSATSYYGLKPNNTLGYVALSARDNMKLEETTNREGFQDTPYYRNFYAILQEFVRFTTAAHTFFGRSWSDFSKARRAQLMAVDSRKDVEELSRDIRSAVAGADLQQAGLNRFSARMSSSIERSKAVIATLAESTEMTSTLQRQAKETANVLTQLAQEASQVLGEVGGYLKKLKQLEDIGQVLEDRVENLRRQLDDMYQAVALGLTAEAIVHEVFHIADNLANRTKATRNRRASESAVESYLEHVQGAVGALRKQVSYLSPQLRYVREHRETIPIVPFLNELASFYKDRLAENNIQIIIADDGDESKFKARMNRGKLSQVCDNFILNSEYWLKQDLAAKRIRHGEITFQVDRPFLRIFDNGRGIDPSVESALFQPFVTAKKTEGRGLGLFIVKQLLDSEACNVGVIPERNRSGRLFKFQIDLRGALNG